MILFPGETLDDRKNTTSGYSSAGGAEKFGTIDASVINVVNVNAQTVSSGWVYAGNISANQITSDTINADRIGASSITATKLASNSVTADKIEANSVTSAKINVSSLSAISANLGNVNVGGSSDSLGTIVVKNGSGTEISKLNQSGIIVRNTRGLFLEGTTGGHYWDLSVDSSNNSVMSLADSNSFYMQNYDGNTNLFTVSSSNGGYFDKQGFAMGNGSSDSSKPRVIKCGSAGAYISGDSYKDITISFGYTFGSDNPFVTATVSSTNGSLGGVHEWNVGLDSFSTSGCHAKVRNVHMATGSGDLQVDWIAVGRTS